MVTVRWRVAVLTTAVVAAALTGCSSDGHPRKPFPSPTRPRNEAQLRQQAQAKLTRSPEVKLSWTGAVKRETHLAKTTPNLKDGKSYVLEAACAGTGTVHFYWHTKAPGSHVLPEVDCGGTATRLPFIGSDLEAFVFEPNGIDPPTGVLAWQIIPGARTG